MAIEQAIIDFVVRGLSGVDAATNKVKADLTSVEAAGKSAATAAKAAEANTKTLGSAVSKVSQAASSLNVLLGQLEAAGFDVKSGTAGAAASAAATGLERFTKGAAVGAPGGPRAAAATAVAYFTGGALFDLYDAFRERPSGGQAKMPSASGRAGAERALREKQEEADAYRRLVENYAGSPKRDRSEAETKLNALLGPRSDL